MFSTDRARLSKAKNALIAVFVAAALLTGAYIGITTLYPCKYTEIIKLCSEKYGLPPELVCAVIRTESRFQPKAVSSKGAAGLMQIMEETAEWAASSIKMQNYSYDRIFEPEINIEIGCWYLSRLIRQYGETEVALAAYNAGSGNVSRWLRDSTLSVDGITLDEIPFGETKRYVERVRQNEKIYGVLLNIPLLCGK